MDSIEDMYNVDRDFWTGEDEEPFHTKEDGKPFF